MSLTPVIVELRTGKALFLGILASICTLVLAGFYIPLTVAEALDGQIVFFGGCVVLAVAAFAAYYLGLAIRKPVALRMDSHGISGFYAEPAVWPEIMEVAALDGHKGARYLCFAFLNPDTIRNRQSAWSKFSNWSRGPFGYRYQIVISQELLLDRDVESLAIIARAFQRDA